MNLNFNNWIFPDLLCIKIQKKTLVPIALDIPYLKFSFIARHQIKLFEESYSEN